MEKMKIDAATRKALAGKSTGSTRLRIDSRIIVWLTTGINAYAMPTQEARATNVYSLSLPVLAVWSQWSNISSIGQPRQIRRATAATIRDVRSRTNEV